MTAAHAALEGEAGHLTTAAAADQLVYLVWLPILLLLLVQNCFLE